MLFCDLNLEASRDESPLCVCNEGGGSRRTFCVWTAIIAPYSRGECANQITTEVIRLAA